MRTWKDISAVEVPARIARLSKDARGYPIPASVFRAEDGTPDFRAIDHLKWVASIRARCCGICGDPLGTRLAFVGGAGAMENRLFTDLPMHRDCATYALQVCPFLAAPSFAYSRKVPEGMSANPHVSQERPSLFGMGISRGFCLGRLPSGDVVIEADPFERVEWWTHGAKC